MFDLINKHMADGYITSHTAVPKAPVAGYFSYIVILWWTVNSELTRLWKEVVVA